MDAACRGGGAAAFTALGLLIAERCARKQLALTNVAWVVMGAAYGSVFPLSHDGLGAALLLIPSASLGELLRAASISGELAVIPLLILA